MAKGRRQPVTRAKRRIWGWMMFDWASQPYSTLILTFIFGPFFAEITANHLITGGASEERAKATAQAYWGYGLAVSGVLVAVMAPVLGAIADSRKRRMPWIRLFSAFYIVGAAGLWTAEPDSLSTFSVLMFLAIGLIGMEFATVFTNAILSSLDDRREIGAISGSGSALGYAGGVVALTLVLMFFAENRDGVTLIGIEPVLGLDPAAREGTRSVGPFTAVWYAVFIIPFFLWVRETPAGRRHIPSTRQALHDLVRTLKSLPGLPSTTSFLASSMFYRDALNGIYTFGGIYALGILGWSLIDVGIFGIIGAISGAVFAWIGGRADRQFGPKPVITTCILVLLVTMTMVVTVTRTSVFWFPVDFESVIPDIAFYFCGAAIGAAGGALQAASRTMLVHQSRPDRVTEAFGLYAFAGKATAFLAPAAIAVTSELTGSQRAGVTPVIALFLVSLLLLYWVNPDGDKGQ